MMLWDLGVTSIHLTILKEKLLLYHYISSHPEESLANQVLGVQEKLHLPSLSNEIINFLMKHNDLDVSEFSKKEWKSSVKEKVDKMTREFLLNELASHEKVDSTMLSP